MLIGIGNSGAQAVKRLVDDGVIARTLVIYDEELLEVPIAPTFLFGTNDSEHQDKLRGYVVSEIENQQMLESDLIVVIAELGTPLAQATMPLLDAFFKTEVDSAIVGIIPLPSSSHYEEAVADSMIMEELCQCYVGFSLESISHNLDNPLEDSILDMTMEPVTHAAELLINGKSNGFHKVSDSTVVTENFIDLGGNCVASRNLYTGQGANAQIAFQQALESNTGSDSKTIISVTGGGNTTTETVNLVREHFTGELWVTERVVESELVKVTLVEF